MKKHELFGTEESAEKWIAEQNKPKDIEIEIGETGSILIDKDGLTINGTVKKVSKEQFQKLINAFIDIYINGKLN